MAYEKEVEEVRERLLKMLEQHPLPWSGIGASRIRDANRGVIVSAEDCTDTEADFIRQSGADIELLLMLVDLHLMARRQLFDELADIIRHWNGDETEDYIAAKIKLVQWNEGRS